MEIKQLDNGKSGKFVISRNGERIGSVTYTWKSEVHITIDYVEVKSDLRGKGLGYKIFIAAMEEVRKMGVKITPICSFAISVLNRTNSLQDLKFN